MNDERKTKAHLIAELTGVRQRVGQLETAEAERKQAEEVGPFWIAETSARTLSCL